MNNTHSQEYTEQIDKKKKLELENLLQIEGSKSKFRARIQLTWLYLIASAIMLICLLATNYMVYDQSKLFYLPIIICSIVALVLYVIYFWRWISDFKKVRNYVQKRWNVWYIWIISTTFSAFLISFICTLIVCCTFNNYTVGLFFLGNNAPNYPIYISILIGIIFDILLTITASSLDAYVIYHVEIDLQKLIRDYDENQTDHLKEKIRQEMMNLKQEDESINLDDNVKNKQQQRKLTQEEIDKILKENSNFSSDLDKSDKNE